MKRRLGGKSPGFTAMLVILAVALWVLEQKRAVDDHAPRKPGARQAEGTYEVYQNCSLVSARNNDGDSFLVRLPDGRTEEFRLYFVDTPESAFKRYAGGDTNHERIRQQAADLGGITPEQAVETGKKAKAFTLGLLGRGPFTISTRWDSPFHDGRYHAFVEVTEHGKPRLLHELLVERGLARITTKGADLPDGTPAARHREKLRTLEAKARKSSAGAWGL
jgi:endonuclease YncB( thermonuclease family)